MDSNSRVRVAWAMALDALTAEVTAAFAERGVQSLLLKGPTISGWLYPDDGSRTYLDSDLLVNPAQLEAAKATLAGLGFRATFGPLTHPGMEAPPGYPWRRGNLVVDLHETLPGAKAPRERVWTVLAGRAREQKINGAAVRVPHEHARIAHIALHAAHHGPHVQQPLRDLRAALAAVPREAWADAVAVADMIGATEAFASGLSLVPEGRGLLRQLGLDARVPSDRTLGMVHGVPIAEGIERLRGAPSLRAKGAMLFHELFPSREFMLWWTPLARRSRRGLVAAYLWRLLYLARRGPAGVEAWLRARHAVRRPG